MPDWAIDGLKIPALSKYVVSVNKPPVFTAPLNVCKPPFSQKGPAVVMLASGMESILIIAESLLEQPLPSVTEK